MNGEVSLDTSRFFGVAWAIEWGSGRRFFSRRGAGGGGGCFDSRFISPDLRGGGGEGGREPRGDLGGGGAGVGVVGLVGGLKLPPPEVMGLVTESGFKKIGFSSASIVETRLLGGD